MEQKFLVSKVDRKLFIPKIKSISGGVDLSLEFKAGVPLPVPEKVAHRYSTDYPHIFEIVEDGGAVKAETTKAPEAKGEIEEPTGFDSIEFLNHNYPLTKDALEGLEIPDLFTVSATMSLRLPPNTGKERLIERILQEYQVRNEKTKAD